LPPLSLKFGGAAFHVVAFRKAGFVCESAAVDYDSIVVVNLDRLAAQRTAHRFSLLTA
jgi:hypothetical protein